MRRSELLRLSLRLKVLGRLGASLHVKHLLRLLIPICTLLTASGTDPKTNSSETLAHIGMMRVTFKGFDEVPNPETKQKEFVFYISFIDLSIPKQPMVLRRGDKVAGYIIGAFIKREARQTANDGVVPGTESTLEIIHEDSGEKHVLKPMRVYTVPRDR